MSIGLGILLLVVGAILKFATHASVSGLDLGTIGTILMAAGALCLILSLILMNARRHTVHEEIVDRRDTTPRRY